MSCWGKNNLSHEQKIYWRTRGRYSRAERAMHNPKLNVHCRRQVDRRRDKQIKQIDGLMDSCKSDGVSQGEGESESIAEKAERKEKMGMWLRKLMKYDLKTQKISTSSHGFLS
ncbi:hypothetical protein GIB67_025417 [Kingdonia uniflora]|uniref:Uncharacterized protein n=1 Tax=Kingdonia uniflora TaxID=39325 RepID=A0A7J7LIT7_9MAGN|nr:hypothetical protein GIB67_025417 [Kingdonia uniflora]